MAWTIDRLFLRFFAKRHQHYRTGCFFKNCHAHVIDPAHTHFFRELMTSQNNEISLNCSGQSANFQCRVCRKTLERYVFKEKELSYPAISWYGAVRL